MKTQFPLLPAIGFPRPRWSALVAVLLVGALFVSCALAADARRPDVRPKLVLLLADGHADTGNTALPGFAAQYLEREFRVVTVNGSMSNDDHSFDHAEEIANADVLLVSVTRRAPPKAQLELIRRHVRAGKAVVGIRTASHSFAISKGQPFPPGGADWPEWDAEVIGGNYTGLARGIPLVAPPAGQPASPIVSGLSLPYTANSALYKVSPLRAGAQPVLIGTVAGVPPEPVAWTFIRQDGGRTFYTSLGVAADFKNPGFNEFLRQAIRWAAGKPGRK